MDSKPKKRALLSPDRIKRLNSIGFSWDARDDSWEESFNALKEFHKKEGHFVVPPDLKIWGRKLITWVRTQRRRKKLLPPERIALLDSLGFIWDPFTEQWEEAFAALSEFRKREGHCLVRQNLKFNGINLGSWVGAQRAKRHKLSSAQAKRLESIGFTWDPLTGQWEEAFSALKEFRKREGHCLVKQKFKVNGISLGSWVSRLRVRKNLLKPEQVKRLNTIGFSWDPLAEQWEKAFKVLQIYHSKEGHCIVPNDLELNGQKIGAWCRNQRHQSRSKLTADQVRRLKSIGFSWDPRAEQWEKTFEVLRKFRRLEGHCRVAQGRIFDGLDLGTWVSSQRAKKNQLTPEQKRRLDSLGFIWKAA